MKYFLLIGALGIALFLTFRFPGSSVKESPQLTPTITPEQTLKYNGSSYRFDSILVLPKHAISLHLNLEDRLTLAQAKETHGCSSVVSAGFYTTDDRPIGYFASGEKVIHNKITSSLFNGFLTVVDGKATIGTEIPQKVNDGLQSGPLLYLDGKPLSLRIKNDEPARRIVAAIDGNGVLNFLAIYDPNATYSGPLLSDLPNVLQQSDINIVDAVNLDGGSASGMISGDVNLGELTTVGSFFCINN